MSRNKTLSFGLLLLAVICFQAQASLFFKNTIMNAHATSSGRIELKKDYSSADFYVEADLSYYPYNSPSNSSNVTNSTNATTAAGSVKMMISIPNEETMVAESCGYFSYYDCSQYSNCYKYSWSQAIDYPTFTAQTTVARGDMYLDYSYWSLSSAYLYIANSCQYSHSLLGYGRSGVLGLGTGGSAGSDFSMHKIFSIYINSDLNGGTLLFKNDASNVAGTSSYKYSFSSNSTWQIQVYSGYLKVSYSAVSFSGNIAFDVNSDAIGIPYNMYRSFISYFTSYSYSYCTSENYRPTCSFYSSGKFETLPDIIINLDGIDLKIPSQIYASKISDGSFYLNLKAISSSLTGDSYVTPSFQNSIILDAHFMSYYYTVFDASSGYNYIYLYQNSIYPYVFSWWPRVVAGAVLIAVILCCCCCSKKKRIPNSTVTTAQINNTTDIQNTTQAPLIYNQQVPVVPTYTYDVNSYNYAGYNAQPQYPGYNAGYQQPQGYASAPGYIHPQAAPVGYPQENAKQ